jgi:hypothetical protein
MQTTTITQKKGHIFFSNSHHCIRCGNNATHAVRLHFHKDSQWFSFLKGRVLEDVGSRVVACIAPVCTKHRYYNFWPWLLFAIGVALLALATVFGTISVAIGLTGASNNPGVPIFIGLVTLAVGVTLGLVTLHHLRHSTIWPVRVTDNELELSGVSRAFGNDVAKGPASDAAKRTSPESASGDASLPLKPAAGHRAISTGVVGFCLALPVLFARGLFFLDSRRSIHLPDTLEDALAAMFLPLYLVGPSLCIAAFFRKEQRVLGALGLVIFTILFLEFMRKF